jgi:GDPmannose 4,6-dehydratase
LSQGYQVTGWTPQGLPVRRENLRTLQDRLTLIEGSLVDQPALLGYLEATLPDEIYNLAAPSSPPASWNAPVYVADIVGLGVARLLEAIRLVRPQARFYQASSSELFGAPLTSPQDESAPFRPRNPYGVAKLFAHWTTITYRQQYGLYACAGILFNHESPRRGLEFVTRKITHTAARIKLGLVKELRLGDLQARRDWGAAVDYVRAMWLMLQQPVAQELVIGTGETHSVAELCELAFGCLDLDYRDYVVQDPAFMRPPEPVQLVANPRLAHQVLGWIPQYSFKALIQEMTFADYQSLLGQPGV